VSGVRELWRDLGRSGRAGVVSGAVALLLFVPLLLVGPLARSALSNRAAERGLTTEIESVRLGLRGVWLRGVTLESAPPSRVTARLDAVLVPFGGGTIEVRGGRLVLRGTLREVSDAVRSKRPSSGAVGGARRELDVQGVDLTWHEISPAATASQHAWGLALERTETEDRVRLDRANLVENGVWADLRALDAKLAARATGRVLGARLGALDVVVSLGEPKREPPSRSGAVVRASGSAPDAAAPGWSGAVSAARSLFGEALAQGAKVEVGALTARLEYEGETLGFGPSRVSVGRDARDVSLSVLPAERLGAGTTPLALGARLPLAEGAPSFELEGGPVSLGMLGVREGDLGLRRVRDATLEAHLRVELVPGSGSLRGSGSGKLANLSLVRPELSPTEIRGIGLAFRAAGEARLDGSSVVVDDAELGIGDVRVAMTLSAERGASGLRLRSKGGLPLASCEAMLASLPKVLVAELGALSLEGTFALSYDIDFATNDPDGTRVALDVKNDCRVKDAPPALSPHRFRSTWVREVKGVDGQSVMIQSGPGAPGWVPYGDISKFMEAAVLICEDGGFYRHRGLDFRAIERALKDDIRAGRFVRGASTISMQLAKNLYLGREKTLARKIQEALLTLLLEQELSKQELMELYLNVVELGPGIYGVGPAAEHYFKVPARDLSLGQALYLASILPDPTRQHFTPDGNVTERWAEYLKKLMRIGKKVDRITDEELEAGLAEQVGFRQSGGAPESSSPEHVHAEGEPPPSILDP
jgi:hypothetical protein